jgi:hypothetical protein
MRYQGQINPIPETTRRLMRGVSWHEHLNCAKLDELSLLTLPHWDFAGQTATGQLIVSAEVAADVVEVFAQLHAVGFRIAQMRPVHHYAGDDTHSMEDNNSHGFNARLKTGSTTELSRHAYGTAIDINPIQNPYEAGDLILPNTGRPYARSLGSKPPSDIGVINDGGPVVQAFAAIGWEWGGHWRSPLDTQHFELRRP